LIITSSKARSVYCVWHRMLSKHSIKELWEWLKSTLLHSVLPHLSNHLWYLIFLSHAFYKYSLFNSRVNLISLYPIVYLRQHDVVKANMTLDLGRLGKIS
jgi:hypothetical protein